jgi:hypothetical protein
MDPHHYSLLYSTITILYKEDTRCCVRVQRSYPCLGLTVSLLTMLFAAVVCTTAVSLLPTAADAVLLLPAALVDVVTKSFSLNRSE